MCTEFYGFRKHMLDAFPDNGRLLYYQCHEVFNHLPLCIVVGDSVAVMHGGLPGHIPSLEQIRQLPPGPVPLLAKTQADKLFQALLWSDPKDQDGPSDPKDQDG